MNVLEKVLDNRLGGLSLHRKSAVRLTDRPNMTIAVYRGQHYNIIESVGGAAETRTVLQSVTMLHSWPKCLSY